MARVIILLFLLVFGVILTGVLYLSFLGGFAAMRAHRGRSF